MNTNEDTARGLQLAGLVDQLEAIHEGLKLLVKKFPDSPLGDSMTEMINQIIPKAKVVLGDYAPDDDFEGLGGRKNGENQTPINTEALVRTLQYLKIAKRCLSDHVRSSVAAKMK